MESSDKTKGVERSRAERSRANRSGPERWRSQAIRSRAIRSRAIEELSRVPGAERRAAEARAPRRHTSGEQRLQLARHMKQRAVQRRPACAAFPNSSFNKVSRFGRRRVVVCTGYRVYGPHPSHQNLVRPSLLGPSVLWYAVTAHLAARLRWRTVGYKLYLIYKHSGGLKRLRYPSSLYNMGSTLAEQIQL